MVYAAGRIANRLYKLPEERSRYRARLSELNDSVWNVEELLEEVRQIETLAPDAPPAALALQRERIQTHPDALRAALSGPAPEWDDNASAFTSPCLGMTSDIRGSFVTSFGNLDSPVPGDNSLEFSLEGNPVQLSWLVGAGATNEDPNPQVRYISPLADGQYVVVQLVVPSSRFRTGSWRFHGVETAGAVGVFSEQQGFRFVGWIGDGAIELTQASTSTGAAVVGSFAGTLLQFSCGELQ